MVYLNPVFSGYMFVSIGVIKRLKRIKLTVFSSNFIIDLEHYIEIQYFQEVVTHFKE